MYAPNCGLEKVYISWGHDGTVSSYFYFLCDNSQLPFFKFKFITESRLRIGSYDTITSNISAMNDTAKKCFYPVWFPVWPSALPDLCAVVGRVSLPGDEVQQLLHPRRGKWDRSLTDAEMQPRLSICCSSGLVHDSLPFLLPLALPRRLHASVQPQRSEHAALGPGVQVSTSSFVARVPDFQSPDAGLFSFLRTASLTCTPRPRRCPTSRG